MGFSFVRKTIKVLEMVAAKTAASSQVIIRPNGNDFKSEKTIKSALAGTLGNNRCIGSTPSST